MIKECNNISGTSWFGYELYTTKKELIKKLGIKPKECCDGKSQYDWWCEYVDESGKSIIFSIYDWKESIKIKDDTKIYWHIGTYNSEDGKFIKNLLK